MPLGPDPELARAVVARLDALRRTVASGEEDVLASLVVTGEPRPQRVLDDWLDQVADPLRALGDTAGRLAPPLVRDAASAAPPPTSGSLPRRAGATSTTARGIRPAENSEPEP